MNPVKALQDHRQAVWLDFLSRGFIADGGLKKLVDDDGLRGVTSNPSIFEQAIGRTKEYDDGIKRMLASQDQSPGQIFERSSIALILCLRRSLPGSAMYRVRRGAMGATRARSSATFIAARAAPVISSR
jgi:Transaldolase/Fructose-6-phosphate aldolase